MRPDPVFDRSEYATSYQSANYGEEVQGRLMRRGHEILEDILPPDASFDAVLELGAGAVPHLRHVRHPFKHYVLTDFSDDMMALALRDYAGDKRVEFRIEDLSKLSFPDASFDRLIATHILEHLVHPHRVLREWARVLRPGGVMSLILPCDPGMLWRLGRHLGPRASAMKRGVAYDYWIAREHVNAVTNLVTFIRYYFDDVEERWYPLRVPSSDLNLFYICNIKT